MRIFGKLLLLTFFFCLACNTFKPKAPTHVTQGGAKVKVEKVSSKAVTASIPHEKFGLALKHLDLEVASAFADDPLKKEILQAFHLFAKGDHQAMIKQLKFLMNESADEDAVTLAKLLWHHLLYLNSDWQKLIELGQQDGMTLAFANKPQEKIQIKEGVSIGKLKLSKTGCPMVEVKINGQEEWFWFDTGASESVISSDLVEALSVERLSGEIDIKSSTNKVKTGFGYIKSFTIGGLHLENHQVFILDKNSLEFKLHNGDKEKIRGIIGWSAIRHLRWELNYGAGTFTNQASEGSLGENTNFLWMGYPIVKLKHSTGTPLLFGLDTGSNKTSVLNAIFNRVSFKKVKEDEVTIGGAGGYETIPTKVIAKLPLLLGQYLFTLKNVQMEKENHTFFIQLDGTLGSDISLGSRMLLDFPKGEFLIIPPL